MSARIEGTLFCTDLGSALVLTATGPRLSVVGLFTTGTPRGSISFNIDNPEVGTFDLAQADAEHDALYGAEDETSYSADRSEGSGTVTIEALSDTRVQGTFAFTGVGYDINNEPTGTQVRVTEGRFDFALSSTSAFESAMSAKGAWPERAPGWAEHP